MGASGVVAGAMALWALLGMEPPAAQVGPRGRAGAAGPSASTSPGHTPSAAASVSPADHASAITSDVASQASAGVATAAAQTCRLVGFVEDATGRRLAGARIHVSTSGKTVGEATTGATGDYAADVQTSWLTSGNTAVVRACAPGFGPATYWLRCREDELTPTITIPTLRLGRAGALQVHVRTALGEPIAADIELGGFDFEHRARGTSELTVEDVPRGWVGVEARAPGYVPGHERVIVSAARTTSLTVALVPGATLRVRAVDSEGVPVEANVMLLPVEGGRPDLDVGITDEDGAVARDDLPAGSFLLFAEELYVDGPVRIGTTHIALANGRSTDVEVVVGPSPVLRGRVLLDGRPAPHAHLVVGDSRVNFDDSKADAEGFYTLEGLPPGLLTVRVDGLRGARGSWSFEQLIAATGTTERDLECTSAIVRGRVLGAGGSPAARAPMIADGPASPVRFSTDADGRFELALGPGSWRIRSESEREHGGVTAEVPAGPASIEVELQLRPLSFGTLLALVRDPHGRSVPKASVVVRALDDPASRLHVLTDLDGQATTNLPAGRYRLELDEGTVEQVAHDVDLPVAAPGCVVEIGPGVRREVVLRFVAR